MTARPARQFSVIEAYLQAAYEALLDASTAAGTHVERGRVDAHSFKELPALNLRRGVALNESFGGGVDAGTFEFEVDHLVEGDDWESRADAMHAEVHAALAGDARLTALAEGLRCIRTDMRAQAADTTRGHLTATYQVRAVHAVADVTNPNPLF